MSGAMQWSGTSQADRFVFDSDDDRLDLVLGGAGDDYISDGADDSYWSSDIFLGQSGDDKLISLDGNDVLRGGRGDDFMSVQLGWYDPANLQFPVPGVEHGQIGYDVEVHGGKGWDILVIGNSEGHTIEEDGDVTIIHSQWGGTVTVHGVEQILFL
jgi:Ca2+-binding RTX toxin-like protein